ncbi:MAG TPA: NHL repeat-containing protein [Solirubrobacterales bacterium]|nr:NHL repeat-containing protein [Solirubrobacterales bacterium]
MLVCVVTASAVADPSTQPPLESAQEVIEGQAPEAEVSPLTDPEAAAELPHADLNRSEALELLEQTFGPVLQAAAGPFAELEVKEFLSNNVAVIAPGSQPESEEGEPQGQTTLLDSTIPLRAPNESGEEEQVDLGLQSNGGALEAENGLVEAALPTELGEGVELPEAGVGIEVEGAAQERSASTTEESVAFYPNVATDSDLALALTPTGVESLTQLRTADAPTSQTFHLSLPAGAELIATKAGGAEVIEGSRTLVTIPTPNALDADGNSVPVQLEVSGDSLTLEATPSSSAAFPILVDPIFETYTWGGNTTAGLEDWIGEHTLASPFLQASKASCTSWCSGFIPDGKPGLWVSAAAGWGDQPGWSGGFHYLIPRWQSDWNAINQSPTSYIAYAHYYGPGFWLRGDAHASPYVVAGLWWPEGAKWTSSWSHGGNEGNLYMNETWNFPGQNTAKEATFGLLSTDSYNLSSGRELFIGYITLELSDEDKPEPSNVNGGMQWVNDQPTFALPYRFTDTGLGVYSIAVSDKAGHSWKTLAGCSGGAGSPCPRTMASTEAGRPALTYDPSVLPQGTNNLELVAADPIGHQSNQALGKYAAKTVIAQVYVDHTAPVLALSGTLTEQAKLGASRPSYALKLSATDGTEAAPQSGVVKTVVEVDGKGVDEATPGCSTENCAISREWTLDASKYAAGAHTVKVTAKDAVGLSTTKTLTADIQPTPPPSVALSGTMTEQPSIGTTRPRYKLHINASAEAGEPTPSAFSSSLGSSGTGESQFSHPAGIAVDSKGFLWAADESNNRIEKFKENGEYLLKFGSFGTTNGKFARPTDIAFAPNGNFWVTDAGNNRVQEFTPGHVYVTQFGTYGSGDGQFREPGGVAVDSKGNVWVTDRYNNRLEEFNEAGGFVKIAGNKGELNQPAGIDIGLDGEIWVADGGNNRVVEFNKAGEFIAQFGSEGSGRRQFVNPDAVEVDVQGNVWVGDEGNDRVQELDQDGEYVAQFGSEGSGAGQFLLPAGIATDTKGGIWVSDWGNNRLQRWQVPAYVPTALSSLGSAGSGQGQFNHPAGIAVDANDNIWVVDEFNSRLEKFNEKGEYLSGFGSFGSANGQLAYPRDVAIDANGHLWVADAGHNRVEEFSESGEYLSTIDQGMTGEALAVDNKGHIWVANTYKSHLEEFNEAGELLKTIGTPGTGEGQLQEPTGIALGSGGNIWTVDWYSDRVSEYDPAGNLVLQFGSEGTTSGKFKHPDVIDIDSRGDVWVADELTNRVQEFNHNGEYVAQFGTKGSGSGQFSFAWPMGIATDSKGNIWVSDPKNNRVQRWDHSGSTSEIKTEVTVDGKQVESGGATCTTETCPMTDEWTLESPSYMGKHSVQVKATDGLGRSTTKTLSVEVQPDTTKPTVELSGALASAPEGWVEQKSYGLTASASDQGGGVTSLVVKIDGSTIASESQGCVEGGCTESITKSPNMANYAGGAHLAEVIATDGAGNTTTKHWTINVDPAGQVSTAEAIDTLEAVDDTAGSTIVAPTVEVIDAEERADGNNPGFKQNGEELVSTGAPVPSSMTTNPGDGFTMEGLEGEVHVEPIEVGTSTSMEVTAEAAGVSANTDSAVDTVVRPIFDGIMTFESIRDSSAPEDYSWQVELGPSQLLKQVDEQHVGVFYKDGTEAMLISAELVHDAVGREVPTTLAAEQPDVITLTIKHRGEKGQLPFVYPVVGGPVLQTGYQTAIIERPEEPGEPEETIEVEQSTPKVVPVPDPDEPEASISTAKRKTKVAEAAMRKCQTHYCPIGFWEAHLEEAFLFNGKENVVGGQGWHDSVYSYHHCQNNSSTWPWSIDQNTCEWIGNHAHYGHGHYFCAQKVFHANDSVSSEYHAMTFHNYGDGYAGPHQNSKCEVFIN